MSKLTLPSVVKDDRKQLKCLNVVLRNWTMTFLDTSTDGETKAFVFQKAEVATLV